MPPLTVTLSDIISPKMEESIKGECESLPIELKRGRYGAYIKWGESNIPLPDKEKKNPESLTIERICEIAKEHKEKAGKVVDADKEFTLPDGTIAYLVSGRYGAYIKCNGENIALSKEEKENTDTITVESILKHMEEHKEKTPVKKGKRSSKK